MFWKEKPLNLPRSESPAVAPLPLALDESFDVVIIGGGAAGLYAALCLPSHLRVALIAKEPLSISASDWAQGGIAAVMAPDDSFNLHIADTLQAGAGLCDEPAVRFLVEQAPHCIQALIDLGVAFDRSEGTLAMTLEAAHSRRRVLHAADTTGRAVVSILAAHVLSRPNIQVISPGFALDLWLTTDRLVTGDMTRSSAGDAVRSRCQGVCLLWQDHIHWLRADAVILATGGGGQVFVQTTNPASATGDGVAIAWRAGAVLRDLEFVQFHPTALTKAGAPRFLISEAVRGEGAHLIDDAGDRFAFRYHPAGELAPRDVVSRAIFQHLQEQWAQPSGETPPHVWLDLRPIAPDRIQHRFPNIIQVCKSWGIDVFQEPIPVAPAAHYWMGGVATDLDSQTSIAGLYAIGEVANTGVHGANRLASNSLLECLVFADRLREWEQEKGERRKEKGKSGVGSAPANNPGAATQTPSAASFLSFLSSDCPILTHLRQQIPQLVWQSAGICRDRATLVAAIEQVTQWRVQYQQLGMSQALGKRQPAQSIALAVGAGEVVRLWAEVGNLLDVAYLLLKSALFRTESRGGHYRADFPSTDPAWQVHTIVQGQDWSTAPVLEQHLDRSDPQFPGA